MIEDEMVKIRDAILRSPNVSEACQATERVLRELGFTRPKKPERDKRNIRIMEMWRQGYSLRATAEYFNMTMSAVNMVRRRSGRGIK